MRQALALFTVAHLVHLRGKIRPAGGRQRAAVQCGQQGAHPLAPQRAAEQAGKYPALRHKLRGGAGRQGACLQIRLHHFVALQRQRLFPLRRAGAGKVYAALAEGGAGRRQQGGLVCAGQVHLVEKQEGGDVVRGQQAP